VNANPRSSSPRTSLLAFVALLIVLAGAYLLGRSQSSHGPISIQKEQDAKEQLVSGMLLDLHTSAVAEQKAVMEETDEASQTYAEESQRKSAAVEKLRQELSRLIANGDQPTEVKLLGDFDAAWTEYRALNREILDLAVENTNYKALRLSIGPASDALQRLEAALNETVAAAGADAESAGVSQAAFQAVVAAYKILSLQSSHIAESSDQEMDRIEKEMDALDEQATNELDKLSALNVAALQAHIKLAQAAYKDFQAIHAEILALSRRNTNVRSLALALGKGRTATAKSIGALTALQKAIRSEKPPESRW
jgi:hypothetical protein